MGTIQYSANQVPIQTLCLLYEKGCLNLEPGFQRSSVWRLSDRSKLIDSIVRNYPLPAIFLHERKQNGNVIYDVIDGKQRIESVLMFVGEMKGNRFSARCHLDSESSPTVIDWNHMKKRGLQYLVMGYTLHATYVTGEPGDVIDLFVRINSTGKPLTGQEKRKAKYYRCDLLKKAAQLAGRYEPYFRSAGVLSAGQVSRMKHVELLCELMVSAHAGDVINKKAALNKIMERNSIKGRPLEAASRLTVAGLSTLKRMFPRLGPHVRFTKLSDFYTLAVLIQKFLKEGLVLTNSRRNKLAWDMLVAFSTGVDQVKVSVKRARGIRPGQESYRDYFLTVLEGTDEEGHRRRRELILRALLETLFLKKDRARTFSAEQRRILWNTTTTKKCERCGETITWANFDADHIKPWSKGGVTELRNAARLCRRCNRSKGNRRSA